MAVELGKADYKYRIKKLREEQAVAPNDAFKNELENTITELKKTMHAKWPNMTIGTAKKSKKKGE